MSDALEQRWRARAKLLRFPLYGGLFAVGALVTAKIFGGKVAESIGERGGEGFAQGVAAAQAAIASTRGKRFG